MTRSVFRRGVLPVQALLKSHLKRGLRVVEKNRFFPRLLRPAAQARSFGGGELQNPMRQPIPVPAESSGPAICKSISAGKRTGIVDGSARPGMQLGKPRGTQQRASDSAGVGFRIARWAAIGPARMATTACPGWAEQHASSTPAARSSKTWRNRASTLQEISLIASIPLMSDERIVGCRPVLASCLVSPCFEWPQSGPGSFVCRPSHGCSCSISTYYCTQ